MGYPVEIDDAGAGLPMRTENKAIEPSHPPWNAALADWELVVLVRHHRT